MNSEAFALSTSLFFFFFISFFFMFAIYVLGHMFSPLVLHCFPDGFFCTCQFHHLDDTAFHIIKNSFKRYTKHAV